MATVEIIFNFARSFKPQSSTDHSEVVHSS